jgi:4-hydroxybenzoate polyprenyltransferase
VIWVVTALALVLWLVGVILRVGQWVNLFLLLAAVLLVWQVIVDRRSADERALARPAGTHPAEDGARGTTKE